MDQLTQIDAFQNDIDNLIDRYRQEFDISVAAVIGVLELAKLDIYQNDALLFTDDYDEDDDDNFDNVIP